MSRLLADDVADDVRRDAEVEQQRPVIDLPPAEATRDPARGVDRHGYADVHRLVDQSWTIRLTLAVLVAWGRFGPQSFAG